MKGTIFKIRLSKSNIFALIPAPMKGTISFFYNNALIPIPTKGTMPGSFKRVFNYKCFNLRTREGYDNIIFASSSYVEHFNPRTREGYDRYRLAGPPQMYSFNPRTHKKYDQPISGTDRLMYALIPVPTEGTIFNRGTVTLLLHSFNPRTHGGYDLIYLSRIIRSIRFNPRTHGGYDGEII